MANEKNITASQVLDLVKDQDFHCAISGRKLTPETASLDHIVPLGRGGEHSIENVWVVDHRINLAKGTMTVEEFVSMCRDVVQHQDSGPRTQKDTGNESEQTQESSAGPPPKSLF